MQNREKPGELGFEFRILDEKQKIYMTLNKDFTYTRIDS